MAAAALEDGCMILVKSLQSLMMTKLLVSSIGLFETSFHLSQKVLCLILAT